MGLAVLLGCAAGPLVHAHKASDSYLSLTPTGEHIAVRWDVALRDLDDVLWLDVDDDGHLSWGEVREHQDEIDALLLSRLKLASDRGPCSAPAAETAGRPRHALAEHSDGTYAVLQFEVRCPGPIHRVDLDYTLFADSDPTHRGIVALVGPATTAGGSQGAVLGPDHPRQSFVLGAASPWPTMLRFAADGVRHIWGGYDHLLFLITLLLPSVLVAGTLRTASRLQGVERLPPALWDVFRIVTAFTVAHSLTLTLAALDRVTLPSRWVESAIAATVVFAAVNNLWPVLRERRWMAAFVFGLIHGFGFGQALKEQALPPGGVALSLLGFNLGVEVGQLAVVAVFVPLAFLVRNTLFYQRGVLRAGSAAVILVALVWFVERAFDLQLLSGAGS